MDTTKRPNKDKGILTSSLAIAHDKPEEDEKAGKTPKVKQRKPEENK